MTNVSLIMTCFLGIMLTSCSKERSSSIKRNSTPIILSQKLDFNKDINPDTLIRPYLRCESAGLKIACTEEAGVFDIDINNDKKVDFNFKTGKLNIMSNEYGTVVQIKDSSFRVVTYPRNIANIVVPGRIGDTITNTSNWNINIGTVSTSCMILNKGYGNEDSVYNPWQDYRYLAFRKVSERDTLFGWIKLRVAENCILTIDSFAIQK